MGEEKGDIFGPPEGADPLMATIINGIDSLGSKIGEMGQAAGSLMNRVLPETLLVGIGMLTGAMSWGGGSASAETGHSQGIGQDAPAIAPPVPSIEQAVQNLPEEARMITGAIKDNPTLLSYSPANEAAVLGNLSRPLTPSHAMPPPARDAGMGMTRSLPALPA